MLSNVALNVAIGLIFVFLLYSLLATIISEFIAHALSLRPQMLFKGIQRMLEDSKQSRELVDLFYGHPNIKYLGDKPNSRPSYLKTDTFTQTVIYMLRGANFQSGESQMAAIKATLDDPKNGIPADTLQLLNDMFADAQGDIDRFRYRIDQWFDQSMQRTSGWYKRQNQLILLIIGFVMAVIGNVDTLKIYNILSTNDKLSEQFANIAVNSQAKYAPAIEEIRKQERERVEEVNRRDTAFRIETKILTTGDSVLDQAYKMTLDDIEKSKSVLGLGWGGDNCRKCDSLHKLQDSLGKAAVAEKDTLKRSKIQLEQKATAKEMKSMQDLFRCDEDGKCTCFWNTFFSKALLGWLITALAISLGAPFWFDLLNKFINLRAAGTKPKAMADTGSTASTTGNTAPGPHQRKG